MRKIIRSQRCYLGTIIFNGARKTIFARKFIQRVVPIRTLGPRFGFALVSSRVLGSRSLLLGSLLAVRHLVGARSILACIFTRIGGGGRSVILRRARVTRGIAASFRCSIIGSAIGTNLGGSINRCR